MDYNRRLRIFIGSSHEATPAVSHLVRSLEDRGFEAIPWQDSFPLSSSIERSFASHLADDDFFVFVLSPDIEVKREGIEESRFTSVENVIFEAGAAYGRHGLGRVIFIKDPMVNTFSDIDGIKVLTYDTARNSKTHASAIASEIAKHVKTVAVDEDKGQILWLSLIKCKPAVQRLVVKRLAQLESDAASRWRVRFYRYGVIWGPPDNFLLFSAPSVDHFVGFIVEMRTRLQGLIQQVDSRLIFPKKFWQQRDPPSKGMKKSQLVFLSCTPERVEKVYEALVEAAKDEAKRGISEVDIVTVGVATGDADVFFITASATEDDHREFIEKHLHNIILEGWLSENTTSLPISD